MMDQWQKNNSEKQVIQTGYVQIVPVTQIAVASSSWEDYDPGTIRADPTHCCQVRTQECWVAIYVFFGLCEHAIQSSVTSLQLLHTHTSFIRPTGLRPCLIPAERIMPDITANSALKSEIDANSEMPYYLPQFYRERRDAISSNCHLLGHVGF
jgi:hypothetical protein